MGEPLPICYLNGEYLPLRDARISPLDRGFLYSDGAYEVTPVYGGRPFRFQQHHDRLTRSLKEIRMEDPLAREAWRELYRELIARNGAPRRSLYICAGDARRRVRPQPRAAARCAAHRVRVRGALARRPRRAGGKTACPRSRPPTRAGRAATSSPCRCSPTCCCASSRWMKTPPNRILLRDGQLTDSSASSVHVVIDGELRTPPNSWKLLPGTTRGVIEEVADKAGVKWRSVRRVRGGAALRQRDPAGRGDA